MKKIITLFSIFLLNFSVFSQEKKTNCNFQFNLTVKGSEYDLIQSKEAFCELIWDFSKLDLSKNKIKIEIVPILDCFNSVNGSDIKDVIVIEINSKAYKIIDSKKIKHLDLMVKCFKYRVIITSDDCNKITLWEFYSYF